MDYFRECIEPVERVLRDSGFANYQIHEILLVGGSTRIPKIRQIIQEFFNGKELCSGINPDEAVACGAAVQGGILSGDCSEWIQDVLLMDVIPFSLGIETAGGVMSVFIPRNSTIPTKKTQIFTTYYDNQSAICLSVFEGERSMVRDNSLLGAFNLEGINPAPKEVPQIEVTFDIDADSIMHINAKDQKSGKVSQITILNENGRLPNEYIETALKEFANYKEEAKFHKKRIEGRNKLEASIHTAKDLKERLDKKIREIEEWIEQNLNAQVEEFDEKTKKLNIFVDPLPMNFLGKSKRCMEEFLARRPSN